MIKLIITLLLLVLAAAIINVKKNNIKTAKQNKRIEVRV